MNRFSRRDAFRSVFASVLALFGWQTSKAATAVPSTPALPLSPPVPPVSAVTTFTYDSSLPLTQISGIGQITTYVYDATGRLGCIEYGPLTPSELTQQNT